MNIIKRSGNDELSYIAVIEIEGSYYVVQVNENDGQVYSIMPSDLPPKSSGGSCWFSNFSEAGIRFVANSRTKAAALSGYYRILAN